MVFLLYDYFFFAFGCIFISFVFLALNVAHLHTHVTNGILGTCMHMDCVNNLFLSGSL